MALTPKEYSTQTFTSTGTDFPNYVCQYIPERTSSGWEEDMQDLLHSKIGKAMENVKKDLILGLFFDHPRMKGAEKMSGSAPSSRYPDGMLPYKEERIYCFEFVVVDKKNHKVLKQGHVFCKDEKLALAEVDIKSIAKEANVSMEDLEWRIWDVLYFEEAQKVQVVDREDLGNV